METYNQLAEAKPRTGPRSGPCPAGLLVWVPDNYRHCRPGAAGGACSLHAAKILTGCPCARQCRSPKSSRTETEPPGRRQDPVTAERGHSTQTGSFRRLQKRREKKIFFFFSDQSSLSTFKTAAQFHLVGDSSLIASKIVYAALLF